MAQVYFPVLNLFFKSFFKKAWWYRNCIYICIAFRKRAKRITKWLVRLSVRTPDFHSGKTGSTPVQATKIIKSDSVGDTNLNRFFCALYHGLQSVNN
jgi:hypothetical protein